MAENKENKHKSEIENIMNRLNAVRIELLSKNYRLSGEHILSENSPGVSLVDGAILIGPPSEAGKKIKYIFLGTKQVKLSGEEERKIETFFLRPLQDASGLEVIFPHLRQARIEWNKYIVTILIDILID
jgi:hypothetical protein